MDGWMDYKAGNGTNHLRIMPECCPAEMTGSFPVLPIQLTRCECSISYKSFVRVVVSWMLTKWFFFPDEMFCFDFIVQYSSKYPFGSFCMWTKKQECLDLALRRRKTALFEKLQQTEKASGAEVKAGITVFHEVDPAPLGKRLWNGKEKARKFENNNKSIKETTTQTCLNSTRAHSALA